MVSLPINGRLSGNQIACSTKKPWYSPRFMHQVAAYVVRVEICTPHRTRPWLASTIAWASIARQHALPLTQHSCWKCLFRHRTLFARYSPSRPLQHRTLPTSELAFTTLCASHIFYYTFACLSRLSIRTGAQLFPQLGHSARHLRVSRRYFLVRRIKIWG